MSADRFSITEFVTQCLMDSPDRRFTAREIAIWIMETHPAAVETKRRNSRAKAAPLHSDAAMAQQIVAEIGSQRPVLESRHGVRTTEERPRKYFFTNNSDFEETESPSFLQASEDQSGTEMPTSFTEADLYPIFRTYVLDELGIYTKRIDERKSSNLRGPNGNRWLYPDIVGMEDLAFKWDREVIDCAKEYSDKRTRLWSFELKLKINGSNIRESYFQAVSNSTWANFGYLVAAEFQGKGTLDELRLLSSLHGIGVINFNATNPDESQILIPAKERSDVDWGTMDRISKQNPDFKEYIRHIRHYYQTGDVTPQLWR